MNRHPTERTWILLATVTVVDLAIAVGGPLVLYVRSQLALSTGSQYVWVLRLLLMLGALAQLALLWAVFGENVIQERRRRGVQRDVRAIIEGRPLRTAFQPVLTARSGACVGLEALARFEDSKRTTEEWFADAAAVGLGEELELLAARSALDHCVGLEPAQHLAINVSPATLISDSLFALVMNAPIPSSQLVLEITEHVPVDDYDEVRSAIARFSRHGVKFAVDDVGAGYSTFRHIVELTPQIIKIDRSIIHRVESNPARQAVVAAIVAFARHTNTTTVAEGVETPDELALITALGVDLVQGEISGRPVQNTRPPISSAR